METKQNEKYRKIRAYTRGKNDAKMGYSKGFVETYRADLRTDYIRGFREGKLMTLLINE